MHTPEQRREVLARDGYRCQQCGSSGPLCVHHVVYRSDGGSDDLDNLATLCVECHTDKHQPDGWNALMRYSALVNVERQRVALHELYSRFIAALYGQSNLPCDLWHGELVIFHQ